MKKIIDDVTIGTDIEVFLIHKETKEFVSAEGYIKGSKHEPFLFDANDKFASTSLDNVAAEFTIKPVTVVTDWITNIKKSLSYINSSIPEHLCTIAAPAANFDYNKYLKTPNAQRFGCEPDLNVWIRGLNPSPKASDKTLRSAGGHIHVGYSDPNIDITEQIIKAMDLFLSIPSVLQEPENKRKELYGKAGAFRIKDYGCEYRTISNYYLASDTLTEWAFNNTVAAIDFLNNGDFHKIEDCADTIQAAINTNDKVLAGNLIRQFNLQMA